MSDTHSATMPREEIRDQATSRKYLEAGIKAEASGDRNRVIEALEAAFAADPDSPEVCFRLAYNLDLIGEEEEAMHLYEQCVQQPRPSLNALINLAIMYEDREMMPQAERCLRQILSTEPNHPRARLYIKDVLAGSEAVPAESPEVAADPASAALDTPVTDFDLSVRTRNALRKMNIRTLADLLRVTEAEMRAYKNFGEGSIDEIKAMLAQKGLRLGQTVEQQQSVAKRAVYDQLKQQTGSSDEMLNRPIGELQFSVRARKALSILGVTSIGDLCMKTEAELMGVKNFGMTSLLEIKERLADQGLSLRKLEG